jgi:hypothetical protein
MRSILVLMLSLCGLLAYATAANAKSCNAGAGCTINCPGGCGCIYDEEAKRCSSCWCEDSNQLKGNVTIDFNGTSWARIGQSNALDVLKGLLDKNVINCLDKRKGELTLSAKSAAPKDVSAKFSSLCQ